MTALKGLETKHCKYGNIKSLKWGWEYRENTHSTLNLNLLCRRIKCSLWTRRESISNGEFISVHREPYQGTAD